LLIILSLISLFLDNDSSLPGLKQLTQKPYGTVIPEAKAIELFGNRPTDINGFLYKELLKRGHVLSWNPELKTIRINSVGMWRALITLNENLLDHKISVKLNLLKYLNALMKSKEFESLPSEYVKSLASIQSRRE